MKTKIKTDYGAVEVIKTDDYFFAGFEDAKYCPLIIEAFPFEGKLGACFFRHGYTLFHKLEDESWDAFFASLDPGWAIIPWARALVGAAFPEAFALQCDYCRGNQTPLTFMTGCTCGVSDAEFEEMWGSIVD